MKGLRISGPDLEYLALRALAASAATAAPATAKDAVWLLNVAWASHSCSNG